MLTAGVKCAYDQTFYTNVSTKAQFIKMPSTEHIIILLIVWLNWHFPKDSKINIIFESKYFCQYRVMFSHSHCTSGKTKVKTQK